MPLAQILYPNLLDAALFFILHSLLRHALFSAYVHVLPAWSTARFLVVLLQVLDMCWRVSPLTLGL